MLKGVVGDKEIKVQYVLQGLNASIGPLPVSTIRYQALSFVKVPDFLCVSRRNIVAETHRNPLRKP